MKYNFCCSDFSKLTDEEIEFLNSQTCRKSAFYLERYGLNRLNFPAFYFSNIQPISEPCINICLDLEAGYLCSLLTNQPRILLLNKLTVPKKDDKIYYKSWHKYLWEVLSNNPLMTFNQDILSMTKEYRTNEETYYVSSKDQLQEII